MPPTLALARDAFIDRMNRETAQVERPRMVAVLDAVIAWSAQRPAQVRFRADENSKGIIRFECVGTRSVLWAATPRHEGVPVLELLPGATRLLSEEEKETAAATLGAHTSKAQDASGRLNIGFGALKNQAALSAVLGLLDELLAKSDRGTASATKVA